jgi:hypothetical protein
MSGHPRLLALQALAAVEALAELEPGWEARCSHPTAWLMGIITRALREYA